MMNQKPKPSRLTIGKATPELDVENEPEQLVIVVSRSERVVAIDKKETSNNGRVTKCEYQVDPIHQDTQYNYYIRSDYYNALSRCRVGEPDPGNDENEDPEPMCDRDKKNGRDVLLKAKIESISSLKDLEGWPAGNPEFKVVIIFGKNPASTNSTYFDKTTKYLSESGWHHRDWFLGKRKLDMKQLEIPIVTFDKSTYGDRMKYVWIEEDPGENATWSSKIETTYETEEGPITSKGTVQYEVDGKLSESAGDAIVEYCNNTDGEGTKYSTGIVKFWVNQEN